MSPTLYACESSTILPTHCEAEDVPDAPVLVEGQPLDRPASRDAFNRQVNAALWARAESVARRYLGSSRGRAQGHDLVQTVLINTLSGVLAWDPDSKSLLDHVCDGVKSMACHQRGWERKFPHVQFDGVPDDGGADVADDVALALSMTPTAAAGLEQLEELEERARAVEDLRQQVAGDEAATVLLNVVGSDDESSSLLRASGLSDSSYRYAMRRLRRLGGKLRADASKAGGRR